MKNDTQYNNFDNYHYQAKPSDWHIEHKYLNKNSIEIIHSQIKTNFFNKIRDGHYQTIEQEASKHKKMLNNTKNYNHSGNKYNSDLKKECLYRNLNQKNNIYPLEKYKSYEIDYEKK